jgi:hypothetical protein
MLIRTASTSSLNRGFRQSEYRLLLSQIITRHGDRSPAVNFSMSGEEARLWTDRLPKPLDIDVVSLQFPVQSFAKNPPIDGAVFPFAQLSKRGMDQLQHLGRRLATRCGRYYQAPNQDLTPSKLLQGTKVLAVSTNYKRTQLSAQCLLSGFLSEINAEEFDGDGVNIVVKEEDDDSINTFDRSSGVSLGELCRELEATKLFVEKEETMQPVKDLLLQEIALFADDPDLFKWINAADYFVCAGSHNDDVAERLQGGTIERAVMAHLHWKFFQWYSDPGEWANGSQRL